MSSHGDKRADMVEAARKFMMTPKVRQTPFEEQRQFLLNKGVTEAEISEARASIPRDQLDSPMMGSSESAAGGYNRIPEPTNRFVSVAQSALVIGSVSYAGYRFIRSFVLPKFFDIPDPATEELRQLQAQVNDLQNSIKFVIDSVNQTTQTLALQQQDVARAFQNANNRELDLSRVEKGISSIKSLLLSHTNFAPIVTPMPSKVPSWQSAGPSTDKPANARGIGPSAKEMEDDEFVDTISEQTSQEMSA